MLTYEIDSNFSCIVMKLKMIAFNLFEIGIVTLMHKKYIFVEEIVTFHD